MNALLSKKKVSLPIAILVGQLAPAIFIYLDLTELGLELTLANSLEVYESQKIYLFSSIAFPLFLVLIFLLYNRTQKQKIFYQSILDDAQELVVVLDDQMNPIYKNAAFDKYGLGQDAFGLIKDQSFPQTFEFETTIHEEKRYLLCSATRSEGRNETTLIFRDLTILKVNAKKIKEQEDSIMRSSQLASLGEISSGIAHEINNPLGVIIGNTDIIRNSLEYPPPLVLKCLDTIDRMGLRITGIIKAMKNLSRKAELEVIEDVEMSALIEDITNISMPNFRKHEIDFHVQLNDFKDKYFCGSSVQISQVLLNLISNATQAIEGLDQKWLRLTLEEEASCYKIVVQNSGPQIPKDIQDKIFQPFFTTKSPGSGTGLGLSLSKTIAELHKGTLILDGANEHPTFILSLPKK